MRHSLQYRVGIGLQGDSGTVETETVVKYVEGKLCPVLGDICKGEPISIEVLDGEAVHMDEHMREAIESKGLYLLPVYNAPYSPDINPIE